jgi:TRAP-type C4-dicarboxylate transport system permease small subunit
MDFYVVVPLGFALFGVAALLSLWALNRRGAGRDPKS